MMWSRYDLIRVTAWRDNAVYRTQCIGHIWFSPFDTPEYRLEATKRLGADQYVVSSDNLTLFCATRPSEEVYA